MKTAIAVYLLTGISGCASRYAATSLEPLFDGSAAPGQRVIVEGRVEMPGANLDALTRAMTRATARAVSLSS